MEWNFLTICLSILDILIMSFVIYKILMLLKDSRAMQLLKGVLILFGAYIVSGWLSLTTVHWILGKSWSVIVLGIAIIFQPELRNGLEKLGRGKPLFFGAKRESAAGRVVDDIVSALYAASFSHTGILLVFQGRTGLKPQIETGVIIDAKISSELLLNLFFKNAPLHDGAVIISGNRILAAGCIMPLTADDIDSSLGTRHRAAIGTSEMSDALVLVVSEETGAVSIARQGHLQHNVTEHTLRRTLTDFYGLSDRHYRKKRKK